MANGNNIAEFILKITAQGTEDARQFAVDLRTIDQAAGNVATSAANANRANADLAGILGKGGEIAKGAAGKFLGLNAGIGLVQQSLGVGFSIAGVAALAESAAQTVRSFEQIADMMDIDIGKASQMAFAVEKTGRSYEVLRQSAMFASVAVQQMPTNSAKRGAAVTLGIDPNQTMTAYELIKKVGDAYNSTIEIEGRVVTQEEKMRAARELLGRSVVQLLPAFHEYWATLDEGRKLTEEEQAASEKFLRTVNELKNTIKFGFGIPVIELINSHKEIIAVVGGLVVLSEAIRLIQNLAFAKTVLGIVSSLGSLDLALIAGAGTLSEKANVLGLITAGVALDLTLIAKDIQAWHEMSQAIADAKQSALDYAAARKQADATDSKKAESSDPLTSAKGKIGLTDRKIGDVAEKLDKANREQAEILERWKANAERVERSQIAYMVATPEKQKQLLEEAIRSTTDELTQTPGYQARQQEIERLKKEYAALLTERKNLAATRDFIAPPSLSPKPSVTGDGAEKNQSAAEIKKAGDQELKVLKDKDAALLVAWEGYWKSGLATEQDYLGWKHDLEEGEYNLELASLQKQQAVLKKEKDDPVKSKTRTPDQTEKLVAEQTAVNARLLELASTREKNLATLKNKSDELTRLQQKQSADAAIKLATALKDKQLEIELQFQQERQRLEHDNAGTLSPTMGANLTAQEDTAKFYAQTEKTKQAVTDLNSKIQDTSTLMAHGDLALSTGRTAIKGYEDQIHSLIRNALPDLAKLIKEIEALGKQHPELKINTTQLRRAYGEMQSEQDKTFGTHQQTQLQQTTKNWGDMGKQLDGLATGALQNFSHASTSALMGLITGSKSAGQAFEEFALSVIQSVIEMVIQYALGRAIIAMMGEGFQAATLASAIVMGGSLLAAYAPAAMALSIATEGEADVAGMTGYSTAMGMAFMAEGGLITGGTPGKDSVPAMLMPGEFVLPARAVNDIGVDRLEGIRKGLTNRTIGVPAFSAPARPYAEAGQRGGQSNVTVKTGAPDTHVLIGDREIEKVFASPSATKFFKTSIAVHGSAINDSLTKHRGCK